MGLHAKIIARCLLKALRNEVCSGKPCQGQSISGKGWMLGQGVKRWRLCWEIQVWPGPWPSAAGASPSVGTALSQGRGRAAKDRSSAKPRAAGTQAGPSYSSKLHARQEKSPLQPRGGGQKHLVTMKNLPSPFLVPQQPERSWNEDSAMALEMKRMI